MGFRKTTHTSDIAVRAATRLVTWYQYLAGGRPPVCRYVPSCSNYAIDALEGHGMVRGSWLALRRLVRCNPWGRTGWDPVRPPTVDSSYQDVV